MTERNNRNEISTDDIYLTNIDTFANLASNPKERTHYLRGFESAITLYDQYFQEERITYQEARERVKAIMEVMHDNIGSNSLSPMRGKAIRSVQKG